MRGNPSPLISPSLEERFSRAWESDRVLLFSAPCGFGKTVTAGALLRGRAVIRLNAADALFSPNQIPAGCEAVLVDDLQLLLEPERQQALQALIRGRSDLHFVLLSRGRAPGWLIPFELAGIMAVFSSEDLFFDAETSHRMLESRGAAVTPAELSAITREMRGYPLGLELLSRKLAGGKPYGSKALAAAKRDLFVYYDETILHRFTPPLRTLLISLAPFECFTADLAKMVSGEDRAGELLGIAQRDTTMLLFDGTDNCRFWPIFREFLLWKFGQTMTDADQAGVCSRAALYYELRGELDSALAFYSRAGEAGRVSALLVKNAEQHPGAGHYREMQDYYFALPQEEILRSPALMCGMSMLTALTMDYETSEQWYKALKAYTAKLKKDDPEYRDVRGRLAYLDIALPQHGARGLVQVIRSVFRVMRDKHLNVPSFSVTSTLPSIMNGGKDFCEWSKRDDVLYASMRTPVETVLGRDGVGLADCAICESKFEKGEDVSEHLLTLMSRLNEIQARGTPDIEFAAMGLLARIQVSQGRAETALQSIESLRGKYERTGETRFFGNIDALCVRIRLRLGDEEAVRRWLDDEAPKNDARLWSMWRYQYLTRAMAQLSQGETDEPLLLLARLVPYCEACGRVMDRLHIRVLTALCRARRQNRLWADELAAALDTALDYQLVWPIAQYGIAVLPLLRRIGWSRNAEFLNRVIAAAQTQAVFYPKFLKPCTRLIAPLSSAETQVLRLLCRNLSNQEIGEILNIKLATVKTHVSHILQKLNAQNRAEAREAAEALHLL